MPSIEHGRRPRGGRQGSELPVSLSPPRGEYHFTSTIILFSDRSADFKFLRSSQAIMELLYTPRNNFRPLRESSGVQVLNTQPDDQNL